MYFPLVIDLISIFTEPEYNTNMSASAAIIGHHDAVSRLRAAAASGQPAHAYLIVGPANVGKTTVARQFAAELLCAETNPPCGQCADCRLHAAGNHPDFLTYSAADGFGIANVRELKAVMTLRRHSARFRVCLLSEADRLSIPAQNALLKLLEEPPPQTVVILTAGRVADLLPTTVSRCEVVRLHPPTVDELAAGLPATVDRARIIAVANRRPGLALQLAQHPEQLREVARWEAWLRQAASGDTITRLELARELAELDTAAPVLDHWLAVCRQALHAELATGDTALSETATQIGRLYSPEQLRRVIEQLFAARQRLSYNPNTLLLLERTLLTLGD